MTLHCSLSICVHDYLNVNEHSQVTFCSFVFKLMILIQIDILIRRQQKQQKNEDAIKNERQQRFKARQNAENTANERRLEQKSILRRIENETQE